jgi:hypothetical protein
MVREPRDEASVEIDKANKGLHLLFYLKVSASLLLLQSSLGPFSPCYEDDDVKVLNPGLFKLTFLWPKVQLMLMHMV